MMRRVTSSRAPGKPMNVHGMKLAGTQNLLRKLATLERDPQGVTAAELRQCPRTTVRAEAELTPLDRNRFDRTPLDVAVRDLSRCGVGFVATEKLEVGSLWRCGFIHRNQVISHQTLMIRHCTRLDDGIYLAGGQFVIDPATLAVLGVQL